jgi:hypothetical protein
MEIQLATERLFLVEDTLTLEEAERQAGERRSQALGSGLGGLLQRPKLEDVVLIGRQKRLDPIWHVAARARYVYERGRTYVVPASAADVEAVTLSEITYEMTGAARGVRSFSFTALEHCLDEFTTEVFLDGVSGAPVADAAVLMSGTRSELSDLSALPADGTIVIPPEQRASFVVRKVLSEAMKPLQADKIIEESIVFDRTDLIFRPKWAFEYAWTGRDRKGVVEIDAVTGETRQGKQLLTQIKGMMTRDVLFDIGADAVGLFVPGGSIVVKVAKAAIDRPR